MLVDAASTHVPHRPSLAGGPRRRRSAAFPIISRLRSFFYSSQGYIRSCSRTPTPRTWLHADDPMTVNQVCRKCLTCLPTDTRPDPAVASPTLVIVIPRSCLCRSAGTVAGSASEPSSLVTPHHTYTRTGRQSAEMKCISEVTATPWRAILSIYIDLLSLRSF